MLDISQYPYFGYDTETTGLLYPKNRAFGFSIATPDGKKEYHDIRKDPRAKSNLNRMVKNYRGTIIAHNASFDYRMSNAAGIHLPLHCMDDTVIRACAIDEHLRSYEMDYLAKKYIGMEKVSDIYQALADLFGGKATRKSQMANIQFAPPEVVASYAEEDALIVLRLWEWQQEEIRRQNIQDICEFERRRMPTFIRAEMRGIRIDEDYAIQAADKLTPIIDEAQAKLNKLAGTEVNANSPPQVKALFKPKQLSNGEWVTDDGTPLAKTPKGGPSLGADQLRDISDPKAPLILEIRSLIKTRDTFLLGHVVGHSIKGRVYPTINQSKGEDGGTGTGRLSYQNPAMQQIPSRNKKVAAIVKPCFLPDEGMVWVDSDMASFEVRVFAHLVNNPQIIQAYIDDPTLDLHQFVADLMGIVRDATYSGQANSKQLNLSMIFNSGDGAIANKIGLPWTWESFENQQGETITYRKPGTEAVRLIAAYHRRVPGVKKLASKAKRTAENRGYLYTYTGRRLRFPRGWKSYKASGILIQATAADLNKENWGIIEDVLGDDGHLILNTHDSYSMCLPEDWRPYYEAVKAEIEKPRLRVPLKLDLSGVGHNWWSALQGELNETNRLKHRAVS